MEWLWYIIASLGAGIASLARDRVVALIRPSAGIALLVRGADWGFLSPPHCFLLALFFLRKRANLGDFWIRSLSWHAAHFVRYA